MLANISQVILGTVVGCRFPGNGLKTPVPASALSVGATVLTLGLVFAGGLAMQGLSDVSVDQAHLALAPGGLTKMGLIALAIHAGVTFFWRCIMVCGSCLSSLWRRWFFA